MTDRPKSPWAGPRPEPASGQLDHEPHCPSCGTKLDGWTALDKGQPKPGDITICLECVTVLVFGEGLTLAKPDEVQEIILKADPEVKRGLALIRRFKAEHGGRK